MILYRTGDDTATLHGELRDAEPIDIHLELDPTTLLLRTVDAPAKALTKVPPDELLAMVTEGGSVTALAVAKRFGVTKNTARAALEAEVRLDVVRDQRLGDRYFIREEPTGGQ